MHRSLASTSASPVVSASGLTRRRFPALAAFAVVAAMGLAACSTTDGAGGAGSGEGASTSGRGVDRGVSGASLTGDQLREALAREGVSDRVLFGYDSSDLNPESRAIIEKWAKVLNQAGGTRIVVEGHCDERGTREYNLALGERRASAVRNYLASLGVNGARMQTISYGKEKPVVVGSNEQSWAQNRRGVLAVE
jgi:peptidoglycan-associated lipoprotein